MSGAGSPLAAQTTLDGTGLKIAIVAGRWHSRIADALVAGSLRALEPTGADVTVIPVPGSFELPLVAKAALESGYDAVVALGVIIRGGTPHFEYVSSAATEGLTRVALDTGKPVGFGVLTLDDEQQGIDRAGLPESKEDKGAEASLAALEAAIVLRGLRTVG